MTRPITPSKLFLIADPRSAPADDPASPIRRYRLARLRFESREDESRFEHLKRVYD